MAHTIRDTNPATDLPSGETIESLASKAKVTICYARTRCAHGYTRDQTCIDCEQGYSTDGHQYANLRYPAAFAYFGDDGTYVAYIAKTPDNVRKLIRAGFDYFTITPSHQFWQ